MISRRASTNWHKMLQSHMNTPGSGMDLPWVADVWPTAALQVWRRNDLSWPVVLSAEGLHKGMVAVGTMTWIAGMSSWYHH